MSLFLLFVFSLPTWLPFSCTSFNRWKTFHFHSTLSKFTYSLIISVNEFFSFHIFATHLVTFFLYILQLMENISFSLYSSCRNPVITAIQEVLNFFEVTVNLEYLHLVLNLITRMLVINLWMFVSRVPKMTELNWPHRTKSIVSSDSLRFNGTNDGKYYFSKLSFSLPIRLWDP